MTGPFETKRRGDISSANWIIMVLLFISVAGSLMSLAKDKKLTPEELIAEHIKAIGSPKVRIREPAPDETGGE